MDESRSTWSQDYDEPIARLRHRRRPRLFIISGPSGVGKDAVIERLRESELDSHFAITATTRSPRPGELDGVHYYFLTEDQFSDWETSGKLLEHAQVYQYRYGVPREPIASALSRGQDVVIKIDVQGAASLRRTIPGSVGIFLAPESLERLHSRLATRNTDTDEQLQRRSREALKELERAIEFDFVVFNETNGIMRAVDDVRSILLSERSRVNQPEITV